MTKENAISSPRGDTENLQRVSDELSELSRLYLQLSRDGRDALVKTAKAFLENDEKAARDCVRS